MNVIDDALLFEAALVSKLGWPFWACRSIEILVVCVIILSLIQIIVPDSNPSNTSSVERNDQNHKDPNAKPTVAKMREFRWFQVQYLLVYLVIMLADWLQGTNMYTLYASYKVDIGMLYLTGFLSSAVFGTFLGVYVDKWGRKLGCVIFCVLEIVINLIEHVPSMPLLLFGRVLGGLSTSLLFSAFESWMVSEHRNRKFPEHLLASTFSISAWGNGVVAIVAGVCAQFASDAAGDIGPFQLAIFLTVCTLFFIMPWKENYGSSERSVDGETSSLSSLAQSVRVAMKSPAMICLGLSQACFEGGMYTFVFMWVPTLMSVTDGPLPTGLVFSSMMLAMTIGGMLSAMILPICPGGAEGMSLLIYIVAALAMSVPIYYFDFQSIYPAFLVFEAMVGMFYSCSAMLRSKYYPGGLQSSIMTVFRLPLNLLVVFGTRLANKANDIQSTQFVFGVVVAMLSSALFLQILIQVLTLSSPSKVNEKKKD